MKQCDVRFHRHDWTPCTDKAILNLWVGWNPLQGSFEARLVCQGEPPEQANLTIGTTNRYGEGARFPDLKEFAAKLYQLTGASLTPSLYRTLEEDKARSIIFAALPIGEDCPA